MPTILWFRRDLRLTDLPALLDASAGGADVLACFVLDPRLEAGSGPRRLQFLGDSLREIQATLDGRLLVTRGRPEDELPRICSAVDATAVHISARSGCGAMPPSPKRSEHRAFHSPRRDRPISSRRGG